MGAIANRNIKAGELILKETPIVTLRERRREQLKRRLLALTASQRASYYSRFNLTPLDPQYSAIKSFCINSTRLGSSRGSSKRGLFMKGSRFNHSCRPNCHHYWDQEQGMMLFTATREIDDGEEICISYRDIYRGGRDRRRFLKLYYGFTCRCEACSYSEEEAAASNARRLEIGRIEDSYRKLFHVDPRQMINLINTSLRLRQEEGLVCQGARCASDALSACASVGDRVNTALWMGKLAELIKKEQGITSTVYREVLTWNGEPSRHRDWKVRCGQREISSKVLIGPE